ncbi:unnamed protein product [Sphagnum jensenii]|uniref:Uncharacterized protein n=1 Tax=Sphagnum jensenii TaxID=128206 RepID=A0ABP1AG00_9BRYO
MAQDGNDQSPLQPINTRSSRSFNMKKHTKQRLKSSSIRGTQASEAMHTQPMESEDDNAMNDVCGHATKRPFIAVKTGGRGNETMVGWQAMDTGESWLDGLNWTSAEVGQHASHKAGTGSLAHSLDGFLLPVEEIVAEGRAVVLVNLATAGLLLVTNFRLFFLSSNADGSYFTSILLLSDVSKVVGTSGVLCRILRNISANETGTIAGL